MTKENEYFVWLKEGGRIRNCARAMIVDGNRTEVLVEKNVGAGNTYFNFVGGGVAVGETMMECIERELSEETNATIGVANDLFVVENFFPYEGAIRHSLEHYFEVMLDRTGVMATDPGIRYEWMSIDGLDRVDLRPGIVRDRIIDGTYRNLRHLVSTQHGT